MLLSVIIANYNYGRFLDEAIQSVLNQSCQDLELIIIDGGSSDNSIEVIRKYEDKLSYWVSEKDRGQSDAFNKGFARARGRFMTWLNADDVMMPGTVERLRDAARKFPACEWFVGGCFWLDKEMRILRCSRGRPFSEIRYREGNVNVWGPSSFFTKRLLNAVGGVDVRFKLSMDSDLWIKFAYRERARYRVIAPYAWGLRLHPDAKMSGHNFTPDGQFDTRATGRDVEAYERKIAQLRQEFQWIEQAAFPFRKTTELRRILSASWFRVIWGRLDSWRWAGKYYLEYFEK